MLIRPITDIAEAFSVYRIVGELVENKLVEPTYQADSWDLTQRLTDQLTMNPRFMLFGAFDERGAAMGYICGEIRNDIYSNDICAFELLWVVGDRYRKSGVGLALLDTWEQECKKRGAVRSYMGLSVFCQPEILRKVYAARGYHPCSESYSKTL